MRPGWFLVFCLSAACSAAGPLPPAPAAEESAHASQASPPPDVLVGVPAKEQGPAASTLPETEAPGHVPPVDASMEDAMVSKINAYRAAHGLPPLAVSPVLVDKARSWAKEMASGVCGADHAGAPKICHSSLRDGVTVPFSLLGENVGRVSPPDVPLLETAFEQSPSHSAEMLTPAFTTIGVGVAYRDDFMFVAEELMAPLER